MYRFTVEEDDVSKFIIIHDQFMLRPYDKTKSNIHTHMRVMLDLKANTDPFVQVVKIKEGYKEWWINVGNKNSKEKDKAYEMVKELFKDVYQRLPQRN